MTARKPALSIAVVCVLAAILVGLAILQVHWTNELSRAERERLRASLRVAVTRFRRDFDDELLDVCWSFVGRPQTLAVYADRYENWRETSPHPDLVTNLYIWQADNVEGSPLLRYSDSAGRFRPAQWPRKLAPLRTLLLRQAAERLSISQTVALVNRWTLDELTPALVHLVIGDQGGAAPRLTGAVIVGLDLGTIQHEIFPSLAKRYFGGRGGLVYQVSIVTGNPAQLLFQSSPSATSNNLQMGDAAVSLVPRQPPTVQSDVVEEADVPPLDATRTLAPKSDEHVPPVLVATPELWGWRLIVHHRSGSVEAAVLRLRRRNLTVSLGVLLLLAVSMTMIIVWAQRAHSLARLQMSLVAGVSHELRTPLAVIRSAADNLADGVIGDAGQVKKYGTLIREEDRKLSDMVAQILAFAVESSRYRTYEARPLNLSAAIDSAISDCRPLLESSGATLEKHIDPDLPAVRADAAALGRCLENLLSNAIKYGGPKPWVGIRANAARAPGHEVQVHIEDRGSGIHPDDLRYVFEPFYRGKTTQQVHGTGLGLSLAREIAEAMGGRLSVQSELGRGSCFTLHLPSFTPKDQADG